MRKLQFLTFEIVGGDRAEKMPYVTAFYEYVIFYASFENNTMSEHGFSMCYISCWRLGKIAS